ncbi:uncharacterized protein [Ptychodera flava]|uniref:uncharacterized protein n=1 Tax=Ptychodera flava TaxID=63121 RepID=UPI00396A87E5
MLRQYFHWVPIIPDVRVDASTMVVGEKCKEQVSYLFSNNPFYRKLPTDGSEDETQYGYVSFVSSSKEPTLQIDFNTSLHEVKVCESNDFEVALKSQLKNLNTTRYGTTSSKTKRPPYDNALLSCHCSECYKILIRRRDVVKAVLKREAFDVVNDVIPVVSEDQAADVSLEAWNYINEMRVTTNQRGIRESEVDAKSLLQASILTACQSVKKNCWKDIKNFIRDHRKHVICISAAIIVLLLIAIAILLSVPHTAVKPTHTTTPTLNTTSVTNTTITSPLMNTTLPTLPTNFTTTENATSISPTNNTVTSLP